MDIVVKSFYRPYYLERCLRSVYSNIQGKYTITVLDDGTPDLYLNRIQELFPEVKIIKSEEYTLKTAAIAKHISGEVNYKLNAIPVKLWRASIANCSDYFLLLEEDAWITNPVRIDDFQDLMKKEELLIVKLAWNNNPALVKGRKAELSNEVEELLPDLPINSLSLLKPYFKNAFRIKTVLNKLGLVTIKSLLPYYQLYTVTSAFFNKTYWDYLWKHSDGSIDESSQLLRAVEWRNKKKVGRYAKANVEHIKTSFITSSVNRLTTNKFDLIRLNHHLNESWLRKDLDAMQNFPNDFNLEYLQRFIVKKNDPLCTTSAWNSWIALFKSVHRQAGSVID